MGRIPMQIAMSAGSIARNMRFAGLLVEVAEKREWRPLKNTRPERKVLLHEPARPARFNLRISANLMGLTKDRRSPKKESPFTYRPIWAT
jgi:hypothetical protein